MTLRSLLALLACLALATTPLAAYTIVLKDGSRIEARGKYVLEGGKAIITLQSGTETFIDASEIDVTRTDAANEANLGNVLILEDGEFVSKSVKAGDNRKRQQRLGDLIDRGEASVRSPARTNTPAFERSTSIVGPSTTLEQIDRQPLRNIPLATAIKTAFQDRGLERVAVYQGTEISRPFIEFTTDSEASIFRALEVSAEVLLDVREQFPEECALFEILMTTADRKRAGEFELTPEIAQQLEGSADVASIFVRNVRF